MSDAFEILTALGETANLQFCLDAGDSTSYDGSSQTWTDLTANGQSFFRGTTGGAEASDPTFNGSAGGLSAAEYFSFDGGDTFQYDTTNETWMTNAHKDNAAFTFVFWFYLGTSGAQALAGTLTSGGIGTGFRIRNSASGFVSAQVFNAGALVLDVITTTANNVTAWNFVAVSINEATGTDGVILQTNGSQETRTSTYTSPSSGAASSTMQLGAGGSANIPILSGGRLGIVCGWSRALTSSSLNSIFEATRGRFGAVGRGLTNSILLVPRSLVA